MQLLLQLALESQPRSLTLELKLPSVVKSVQELVPRTVMPSVLGSEPWLEQQLVVQSAPELVS